MPYGPGRPLRDRIAAELVEAGVEMGFNLVDLAATGDSSVASRVLHDADDVLHDIDDRLTRLGDADRASFEPLIAELRREVESAKFRTLLP